MTDTLKIDQQGGVLTLTMNRPEVRNALNTDMTAALVSELNAAACDSSVRVVVMTGAAGAFCAGGDVKAMAATGQINSVNEAAQSLRGRADAVRILHEMPKPTVALLPGAAAGAGLGIALSCDFRLAVSTAKITTAFTSVGLSGDFGISYFLPRIVGAAKALELMSFATVLTAQQALDLGLLTRVFTAESMQAESAAFIAQLANRPTVALGMVKRNLALGMDLPLAQLLDHESLNQSLARTTEDHREASAAFVAKRAPNFVGR